jgi:hypothetical protein
MLINNEEITNLKKIPTEVEATSKARMIGGSVHLIIPFKLCKTLDIKQGDEVSYIIHQIRTNNILVNVSDIKYI